MIQTRAIAPWGVLAGMLFPLPALAQQGPSLEASIASDYRERGLSWSGGRAIAQLYAEAPLSSGIGVSAQATTIRNAARHGGADAAFDLRVDYRGDAGLIYWRGGVTGHLFAGGIGPRNYLEGDATAGLMVGPLDLSLKASYVPPQEAIGGSNFHARARASMGLMGTPLTLGGHIGHSSGSVDDPLRAARLRPGGSYTDWGIGLDYNRGAIRFSLDYTDTDIARRKIAFPDGAGHHGAALVAGAYASF